jgi:hypothetical protein
VGTDVVSSWRKLVKCGINSLRRPTPTGYLAVWLGCLVISRRSTTGFMTCAVLGEGYGPDVYGGELGVTGEWG